MVGEKGCTSISHGCQGWDNCWGQDNFHVTELLPFQHSLEHRRLRQVRSSHRVMLVCPTKASGTERQFASINRSRCFSENVCRVQEKIIKKILSICVSLSAIAFIYISSLFLFLLFSSFKDADGTCTSNLPFILWQFIQLNWSS